MFNRGVLSAWTHRRSDGADFWFADPALAERVEAWWAGDTGGLAPVAASRFATVHTDGALYFKRFHLRDARDRLKHLVRASRARRALANGEAMESLGFHAPEPVALVEQRALLGSRESGLVTRAIAGAPNAREWLNRPDLGVAGDARARRRFVRDFGRLVGRFHAAGLHHGDLRIGNVLARRDGDAWTWYWLDNERTTRHGSLPRRLRVHNLMQVNMERTGVTLADRMRFWRAYLEACPLPAGERKPLARAVVAFTRKRWLERGWL